MTVIHRRMADQDAAMPNPLIPVSLTVGPFTTGHARLAGLSQNSLQSTPWRRVLRGVWVHDSVPDSRQLRLDAVRLILPPGATACGLTAAWLYGVDVRRGDDLDVHVSCPKGARMRSRAGLRVRQETLDDSDVMTIDGIRVTTAIRTSFDCARWLRGVERVVVVDALAHAGLAPIEKVRAYLAAMHRLRNLRRAEAVLDLADALAESAMETRVRVRLIAAGLPRPISQLSVYEQTGEFVARLDLAFPDAKVAVEYDGAFHWDQRRADDRRRDRLRELGWVVLVYSADDYYNRSDEMCQEVARHLARRSRGLATAS
jgi:very-short-patch-repair endonuclease